MKKLREKGILPAVIYGPKIKNISLELNLKEFKKIYQQAGESSLVSLDVEGKKFPVLIHETKKAPISGGITHVDFYQPILTEEVEVVVPLVFIGEAPAAKELGGTLVKEIQEIKVKALPQNLPHEIKVNVERLKTFEDEILIKDLELSVNVKISRNPEEIVALVVPPQKIEEELEKPIEEKVEEVEKVEKPEKKEEAEEKEEQPEKLEKTKEPKKEKR